MALGNVEIINRFVDEYVKWSESGKAPDIGSLDLEYAFDLQRKRLESKNITLKHEFTEFGDNLDNVIKALSVRDDGKFYSQIVCKYYNVAETFFVDRKKKKKFKDRQIIYTMITRLKNQNSEATYCCPNCGAISDVKTLLKGCPNCNTRFIMDDLFPKVTNFYFVKAYAQTERSFKVGLAKWIIPSIIVCIALSSGYNLVQGTLDPGADNFAGHMILCVFSGIIAGAIFGDICYVLSLIGSVFKGAAKSVTLLAPKFTAEKRLPQLMKQIDHNFSYEYFVGKMLALVKMMIFSGDYSNLAVYEGQPMQNKYTDIVDVQYRGVIRLNSFNINGEYCYVDITVYATTFREKDGSVRKKDEKFRMAVCKNIHAIADEGFSMKKVSCKSCGASFDATREHNCPYCGNAYHLGDDDWVVLNFSKV
ncbi:MAG: hypothetical protein J1E85_08740 [Ruminococcus sp.]|nr:hypothetical protein [Ruminococcus sp.]